MGQYHHPVCIEAEEGLNPADMDSGLKEGEQGFNRPSTPNAIVALVCARGGNMPADCSQSPLIGRWAGRRVLIQGDYAEDNDIPGWKGPRLSKLYRAMRPVEERKPKKDWRSVPVFADITRDACAFLEAACHLRYFDQEQVCKDGDPRSKTYGQVIDRWTSTHSVQVKPVARHFGNCGVAEYVIDSIYNGRDLEYLKRCGMKPEDVQRAPRSGDWHGFLPEEIPEGQTRVIVNLDTLEYINPVKFGQEPNSGRNGHSQNHLARRLFRDGLPGPTSPTGSAKSADPEESKSGQPADHRRRGRPFHNAVPSKAPRRRRHPRQR